MKHLVLAVSLVFIFTKAFSADDHDHDKEVKPSTKAQPHSEEKHADEESHEHGKEEGHSESEHKGEEKHDSEGHEDHKEHDGEESGHADHEEENSQVGPNKGITEASEENGIKLSPEAEKNFEIEKVAVNKDGKVSIHISSIVTAGIEVNVFRYRRGFYKRIDFKTVNQANHQITLTSKDLASGDFVVIQGLGFLRIAEIAAFGGAPTGHSH